MSEEIGMKNVAQEPILLKRLRHGKVKREYLLYVPRTYSQRNESPVVLNFHGFGSTAAGHLYYSDWRKLSDAHGFVLIYPQGLELNKGGYHWNPDPFSKDSKSSSNDLGFVKKLINKITKKYSIDSSRVYATGFSNGAGMTYGLARHCSDLIAGIAPVSGLASEKYLSTNSGISPVGIISFNGSEDWERPLSGIEGYLASVIDASDYWSKINSSDASQHENLKQISGRHVERTSYIRNNGSVTIEQHIIKNGGHEWFDLDIGGKNLNQLAWGFLSRLRKESGELVVAQELFFDILAPISFRSKAIDEIINFNSSSDTIRFDLNSFGIEASANYASGRNKKVVKKKFAEMDFDFLYDQKKGNFYFNENGSDKGFGNGGIIATLKGAPSLTAENIDFI